MDSQDWRPCMLTIWLSLQVHHLTITGNYNNKVFTMMLQLTIVNDLVRFYLLRECQIQTIQNRTV